MTRRRFLGVTAVACVVAACDDSPTTPEFAPAVAAVVVDESGGPIFRYLDVELDREGTVEVQYWTDDAPRLMLTSADIAASHRVFLPRLRANSTYQYEISPVSESGLPGDVESGTLETGSLPEPLADYQIQTIGTATFPLVMLSRHSVIIDTDGYIVWYDERGLSLSRRANGDFVFLTSDGLFVVTPEREVVAELTEERAAERTGLETFAMHHDVIPTPSNTLLFLTASGTAMLDDTVWVGDEVWEWDPETDDLDLRWSAKDFLTPEMDRGERSVPSDWLHANSIALGPRGNVLVSFFWVHEVISIAADFQSLEWRLGGSASSFEIADGAMEAGQHTAAEVRPNRVLLFDNGRDRPSGELFSRASELELDTRAGTARIVWEFRPRPDIYAPVVSSARRLENGNTLVGFGTEEGVEGATGPVAAYEVEPGGRILWQAVVVNGANPLIYRFEAVNDIAGEIEVPVEGT